MIQLDKIKAFLENKCLVGKVLKVRKLGIGTSHLTYLVISSNGKFVLRLDIWGGAYYARTLVL